MSLKPVVCLGVAAIALAALTPACSSHAGAESSKASVADELTASRTISMANIEVVASLDYGQTSDAIAYTSQPRYRAIKFGGNAGDNVDIWVRSQDGDAVAWLLDNDLHVVAQNDDADDTTTDSHIVTTLPANASITHYVVFREYSLSDATFTVALQGTPDFFSCASDADCVAVSEVSCCPNGTLIAVNGNQAAAYEASFTCPNPNPICSHLRVNDTRVAECNIGTSKCEMVAIDQIKCQGNMRNAHQCPTGYVCNHLVNGHLSPDLPGHCDASSN